jgi:hypothetical protein
MKQKKQDTGSDRFIFFHGFGSILVSVWLDWFTVIGHNFILVASIP